MYRIIVITLLLLVCVIVSASGQIEYYDIVIYGGGFAGCAAASSAAELGPDKDVLLIIPEPVQEPGGLGTVGGQNFTDIRYWKSKLVTLGSFMRWYSEAGQFYNTKKMAQIINNDLKRFPNLKVIYSCDIKQVRVKNKKIRSISICPVLRDGNGLIEWQSKKKLISGKVYIDASDEGRLARLVGVPLSVGRQDWPAEFLDEEEKIAKIAYQQAATLMFKVTGVKTPSGQTQLGEWYFTQDDKGSWGIAGGKETWKNNPKVIYFNSKYAEKGFSIKPLNAAQDGVGSNEWWINMLLIYNVDARAQMRDLGTLRYPQETMPNHLAVDQAWAKARDFLKNPDFINTLREFKVTQGRQTYGFGEAALVLDTNGNPVVGDVLYIRESVHSRIAQNLPRQESENLSFAVSTLETQQAGADFNEGKDAENYPERIGLGYYMMDINAYHPADLTKSGQYDWPVTRWLRPDWLESGGEPYNPVYLPFQMLVTKEIDNLLLPGYASGCSSFAWAELRVLPNLAVLGDASGIAAVRAVSFNENPNSFNTEQISWVQDRLASIGARLEK